MTPHHSRHPVHPTQADARHEALSSFVLAIVLLFASTLAEGELGLVLIGASFILALYASAMAVEAVAPTRRSSLVYALRTKRKRP